MWALAAGSKEKGREGGGTYGSIGIPDLVQEVVLVLEDIVADTRQVRILEIGIKVLR